MGYAEEAKIKLAEAKRMKNGDPLALAQVYATLAVLEALDEVAPQISFLPGGTDD